MGNRMAKGTAWLAAQLKAHASETVQYARGNLTCPIAASYGRREVIIESGAMTTSHEQWDFVITAADLILGGVVVKPSEGDSFRVTVAGQVKVYEVLPIAGEECFRPCDPAGVQLRIHTKHARTEG